MSRSEKIAAMWAAIDAALPIHRYFPRTSKRVSKPFVNHQARYRAIRRERRLVTA